ncbi:TetR/AcrR family transcriptional regulator [Nocardioides humi]|uniref:TetR/AcrR family transcriptional regulator n=1 Tax=Nocardioides humi TaxID=449461 RepID=A0ABN2BG42_9ACTN|nr:TetR/AcrR family transcriptional regulator C-terminal domain-containing protein [Nocardioides humi]
MTSDGPRQPRLSRASVLAAAIGMLDEHGLDSFTMRGLARELGVPVTNLYWHVGGREQLVQACRDAVSAEVEVADPVDDWREVIRGYLHSLRAMVLAHPWVVSVGGSPALMGAHALEVSRRAFAAMEAAGLRGDALSHASSLLTSFAVGSAVLEASTAEDAHRDVDRLVDPEVPVDPDSAFGRWLASSAGQDVAALQRRDFEVGVGWVLDTLAAAARR